MVKKRESKKGLITFGIASLSAIALSSTIFAAWIISSGDSKDIEGTIMVDTVENQIHTIKEGGAWDSVSNGTIKFGVKSDYATINQTSWLKLSDPVIECLSANYTFTVQNTTESLTVDDLIDTDKTVLSFVNEGDKTKYDTAVTAGYVGALPTVNVEKSSASETETILKASFTFTWGSMFGNKNPIEYANTLGEDATAEQKTEFFNSLNGIYSLNDIKFKLTIVTK